MNSLENRFQFTTEFLAVIEQKNILILCFKEESIDPSKLLFPKGLMLKF